MFADEDSDGDGFDFGGFSFADFGKREAGKTSDIICELDEKLFAVTVESGCDEEEKNEGSKIQSEQGIFESQRYLSQGYDAHSQNVDDLEIGNWNQKFPYLRVVGSRLNERHKELETSQINAQEESAGSITFGDAPSAMACHEATLSLLLEGKQINIQKMASFNEDEGDIEEMDGVLEEIFAIDNTPDLGAMDADEDQNFAPPVEPIACRQDEIISQAVAALWPDVAMKLERVIAHVVVASREANLRYEQLPSNLCANEMPASDADGYESW